MLHASNLVKRIAFGAVGVCAGTLLWPATASAQAWEATQAPPATCEKADFEAVVDEAGASLRVLNARNKPLFQDKLRALKDKRGWSTDQFLEEAAPFVKDEKIEVWDNASSDLLMKIASLGQEGSEAKTPDCALLGELRGYLKTLVEKQNEKWAYMFQKIDAELAK